MLTVSEAKLGGYASILLGAALVLVAASYVLLPRHPSDPNGTLSVAATSAGWFRFLYGVFALGGVLGLAVVRPISALAGDAAPEWMAWARRLAYVAFAVTIVQGIRMATLLPQLGMLYHGCGKCPVNLADQQLLAKWLYATLPIDPNYWVIFGGVSLWTLAVGVSGLVSGRLPRLLAWAGLALTLAYWLLIVSLTAGQTTLFAIASVIAGVVLGPIWYGWFGVRLTTRAR